jgi:hypothetical protein
MPGSIHTAEPARRLTIRASDLKSGVECGLRLGGWPQSVGLYHSWKRAGSPGRITRLLSCEEDQLKSTLRVDETPQPQLLIRS